METSWLFEDGPALRETNREAKEIAEASELPVIRDSLDSDVVGIGGEKTVVNHPYDSEKVVSIVEKSKYDSLDANSRYHIQKILHMLFPTEIPDVHAAYTEPNSLITQKIPEKPQVGGNSSSMETRLAFYHKLANVGIEIDMARQNFINDPNDNLYYVDNPAFISKNIDKLEKAIAENLTGKNQEEALRHLERIKGQAEKRKIA